MSITATIIKDSISPQGIRLTTMQLRYPRFIHAEFMTHRMFSRNASSSRAIPVERLIADIERDPVEPSYWGLNKPGMQAGAELPDDYKYAAQTRWRIARAQAIHSATVLDELGAHKQIVNRLLEPFSHINVVVSATDYENFYALRRHPDAQPEIKVLADAMFIAQADSEPALLDPGEWHLPYVLQKEIDDHGGLTDPSGILRKLSVSRNARTSYFTHEGKPPILEADLKLYERLVGSVPLHASPAEHQATPDSLALYPRTAGLTWMNPHEHGNFRGWRQFRKTLPNECVLT